MKLPSIHQSISVTAAIPFFMSCDKMTEKPLPDHHQQITENSSGSFIMADTILNLSYESNITNSGVTGISPTGASAPDAFYMVSPGATGSYAVAHKSTLGNAGYYSFGAYCSESDAVSLSKYQFFPGQLRRYEVSVLLKDWQAWNSANPPYGDNLFQLKVSNDMGEPLRIMAKRNSIVTRRYNTYQENLVADFRPYVNQWIRFRIDVKWTADSTGYMRIYVKMPDDSIYIQKVEQASYRTFTGNVANGNVGYIKWGVYRECGKDANGNAILTDNVLTRIAWHDDVRIIELKPK